MARRLHDLTLANLDDLPATCRGCTFWEIGSATRGPAGDAAAARDAKEAWWQAVQLEWGAPGKALYVDDQCVGYAAYAPTGHHLRARRSTPPASDDALVLATLWVSPAHRGTGFARVLLQAVLREGVRSGVRAVEAYGGRGAPSAGPEADAGGPVGCVLPEAFLVANGFALRADHPRHPLLRCDLRQTVRESVGHALGEVLSVLARRERAPAPTRPAAQAVTREGRR